MCVCAVCLGCSQFNILCSFIPTIVVSMSSLFISTGYSTSFGPWYRRYCDICISFPQSPVVQPGAAYLSGYKAASQRAEGKGPGTEVGVKGTECHCVFQQGCEICRCLRHSWRRLWMSKGCLWFMNACIHVVLPATLMHSTCTQTQMKISLTFSSLHQPLMPSLIPLNPCTILFI